MATNVFLHDQGYPNGYVKRGLLGCFRVELLEKVQKVEAEDDGQDT